MLGGGWGEGVVGGTKCEETHMGNQDTECSYRSAAAE